MDDALESERTGHPGLKVFLLGARATALFQLAIVLVSGSVALLADTCTTSPTPSPPSRSGSRSSSAAGRPSRRYTYGYGRAEDLAGLFIVAMIALSAVVAALESDPPAVDPQPVTNLGWVLAAGLIGFAGNELVAVYRIRIGRRIGSAALVADGLHARTDGLTSLAVVVGARGVAGFPLADPIVGLPDQGGDRRGPAGRRLPPRGRPAEPWTAWTPRCRTGSPHWSPRTRRREVPPGCGGAGTGCTRRSPSRRVPVRTWGSSPSSSNASKRQRADPCAISVR